MLPSETRHKGLSVVGNVLWFLLAGWWLALEHLLVVHGDPAIAAALAPVTEERPDDSFMRVPLPPSSLGAVLAEHYRA